MDYALSADQMLTKLRRSIPAVTDDDVERWRSSGMLQHRTIDGEVRFFRREPSNLFRFCREARERREHAVEPAGYELVIPPLMEDLAAAGHRLCLPVVIAPDAPLAFRRWRPGDEDEYDDADDYDEYDEAEFDEYQEDYPYDS